MRWIPRTTDYRLAKQLVATTTGNWQHFQTKTSFWVAIVENTTVSNLQSTPQSPIKPVKKYTDDYRRNFK